MAEKKKYTYIRIWTRMYRSVCDVRDRKTHYDLGDWLFVPSGADGRKSCAGRKSKDKSNLTQALGGEENLAPLKRKNPLASLEDYLSCKYCTYIYVIHASCTWKFRIARPPHNSKNMLLFYDLKGFSIETFESIYIYMLTQFTLIYNYAYEHTTLLVFFTYGVLASYTQSISSHPNKCGNDKCSARFIIVSDVYRRDL